MTEFNDPRLTKELALTIGKSAPFTDEDLAGVSQLHVMYATDLAGIEQLTGLVLLTLTGCDPVPTGRLAALPALDSLNVRDSGLREVDGLQALPLIGLDLSRDLVVDMTPALDMLGLVRVNVIGNPLSEESYKRVLPALRERDVRVRCSDPEDWRRCVRMREAGLPFGCYRDGGKLRLNSPGLSHATAPNVGHPVMTDDEVDRILATDPEQLYGVWARRDDPATLG